MEDPEKKTPEETAPEAASDNAEKETATVLEEKPAPAKEEDDFLDDVRAEEVSEKKAKKAAKEEAKKKAAEQKVEEEKAEAALHLAKEDQGNEDFKAIPAGAKGTYEYPEEHLAAIEAGRKAWNKDYKKWSVWKVVISIASLALIIAGWVIPSLVMKENAGSVPLYVALGCAVFAILVMLVYGAIQKKKGKEIIRDYFNVYYNNLNAYVFDGLEIENLRGDVDAKITKEEFTASGLFAKTTSVGSRENITFTYKGMDCALTDAASQEDTGNRGLRTTFVGKYLRTHNTFEGTDEGLVLYFKGNDRALPPAGLSSLNLLEEAKYFNIYGLAADKKKLTSEQLSALKSIDTGKLLVDVTVVIKPGKTYWYLGYEDTLMVLPNQDPFNPNYALVYKKQIAKILEIAAALN